MKCPKIFATLVVTMLCFSNSLAQNRRPAKAVVEPGRSVKGELPMMEFRAPTPHKTLVVIVSGDGGWTTLTSNLAEAFSERHYSVLWVDAQRFFWNLKTPEASAKEFEAINKKYLTDWQLDQVLWVGQRMGANALPFMINRVSPDFRTKIKAAVLMGLGLTPTFQIQHTRWLAADSPGTGEPLGPEMDSLGVTVLCLRGSKEPETCSKYSHNPHIRSVTLAHPNHLQADYREVVRVILKSM